jgi:hypothetical protein
MRKYLVMIAATAALAASLGSSAWAITIIDAASSRPEAANIVRVWDNCGVGRHRTSWGKCISNYAIGPGTRGCPAGYHWGNSTHACFPNR